MALVLYPDTKEKNVSRAKGNLFDYFFLLFAVFACLAIMYLLKGAYEQHYDSQYHQTMAQIGMRWNRFSFDLGANPLTSFGVLPVNPLLIPTCWLGYLAGHTYATQAQSAFQAIVLLVLLIVICRASGAARLQAITISLVATGYIWIPFLSNSWITADAMLGSFWQDSAIATTATFFCFSRIGTRNTPLYDATLILALLLIILWHLVALPYTIPFYILASTTLCLGALVAVETMAEAVRKLIAVILVTAGLLSIGGYKYLTGLFNYTESIYYTTVRPHNFVTLFYQETSMLIASYDLKVYIFFTFAVIGAIVAVLYGNRYARYVVFAAISLEVWILVLGILDARFKILQIAFIYVERTGVPILALLASSGFVGLLGGGLRLGGSVVLRAQRRLGAITASRLELWKHSSASDQASDRVVALGVGALALAIISGLVHSPYFYPGWGPPEINSIPAQIQIASLTVRPGKIFRGRSIALLDMAHSGPIAWGFYFVPVLFKYKMALGYDMMNDAEAMGVPQANEYGHWISPPMVALLAAGFYRPTDLISRAALVTRAFRPNLARLLGVSMVVSDVPIPNETKLYESTVGGHPLYIYKVIGVNIGQYAPTRTVLATNAEQILDQLQAPGFDGRKLAVVEQPVTTTLVPASHVTVRLLKGPAIHVSADSPGTSLLVLPFDFSYCLRASGAGLNHIMPVNLSQTGLLFHGEAAIDIVYRFGLISGTACRARDLARIRKLDLENAATGRLFYDARR